MLQRPKGPKDESCRPDGPKSGVQGWGRGSGVGDPGSGSVVRGPVHWTYAVVRWVWGLVGTVGPGVWAGGLEVGAQQAPRLLVRWTYAP